MLLGSLGFVHHEEDRVRGYLPNLGDFAGSESSGMVAEVGGLGDDVGQGG